MKKLNGSLFLLCSIVFGLATSSAAAFDPTAFISDGCMDASPESVDINTLAAVSGGGEIIVTMVLCDTPASRTQYRVHLDYIPPFASGNAICETTSDDTPKRALRPNGMKDTGPGTITLEADGLTLTYVLTYAELGLSGGADVEIWADTQQRGIADRAPNNTDSCSKPSAVPEVLQITLP